MTVFIIPIVAAQTPASPSPTTQEYDQTQKPEQQQPHSHQQQQSANPQLQQDLQKIGASQSLLDNQNQGMFKSTNNSTNVFNNALDYKDIVSLNMQLKSKSIIGLLFMIALFIVVFRFTRKSDSMKKKLPKTLSLFWFFSTIQLYLDLNILQIDKKPYAKSLLIGISPIDQGGANSYIPEVLHLILFLICLFYFFSLIFRFHELQGREEVEEIIEQMQHQLENQRRMEQGLPPNQLPPHLANNNMNLAAGDINNNGRNNPQELGGLVSQSLIQVSGLTWRSSLEFYHLCVLLFILFLTFVKLLMLHNGILFVRLTSFSINTLDNLEMFTNSPRILALFTVSFLAFSQFVGRTSTDKQQYFFQKIIPFFIVVIHSAAILLKRNLIFTYDDIFCLVIFITSLSLYYTYESPDAMRNGRHANPFLHFNHNPNIALDGSPIIQSKNLSMGQQILNEQGNQGIRVNMANLTNDERLKLLLKNTSAAQLVKILENSNAELANSISKEEIKLRKALIEEELRKRREEHEEYLRQKKIMMSQRSSARYHSDPGDSDEYEDGDGELINDELDEDDYESSEGGVGVDNSHLNMMVSGSGVNVSNLLNANDNQLLMDYIKKTVDKKYDAFAQFNEGGGHDFYGMSRQEAQAKFQQLLLQQLNQQLNEETKKILNLKGVQFGQQFSAQEQELMQKFGFLASQAAAAQQQQQQQQQRQQQQQQQQQTTNQTTQGGQGQQQQVNTTAGGGNAKGTAHKMPTKAPTGRPNQRKRR